MKNKARRGDGIPAEGFKILKDDVVKGLHSKCQQIEKFHREHRIGKCQFSFQSQKRPMKRTFKLPYNCTHFTC